MNVQIDRVLSETLSDGFFDLHCDNFACGAIVFCRAGGLGRLFAFDLAAIICCCTDSGIAGGLDFGGNGVGGALGSFTGALTFDFFMTCCMITGRKAGRTRG